MIQAIQYIQIPIIWNHIGDGELNKELHQMAKETGVADRFIFKGKMDSEHIMDFYTDHPFDVFVNTSDNEGVPVSIMEAFAAGIPVMATDVGGTREIVDSTVGTLLPEKITAIQLADELKAFYLKSQEDKSILRDNAFRRYEQDWNARILAEELADYLKS